MRRRVEVKRLRVQEEQERILWSKQHGMDTYGEGVSDKKTRTGARANRKVFDQCPPRPFSDDSERSDPETASDKDSVADSSIWDTNGDPDMDVDSYDDLTSGCTCGASGRAHSRDCPLNPRSKSGNTSLNPGLGRKGQLSQSLNQRKQSRKRREPLFQPGSYIVVHRVPLNPLTVELFST